jgi:hypothetical protein
MTSEPRRYLAYMLRLWQTGNAAESAWRASLENPHTGERHGFVNLDLLFTFLEEHTRGLERQAQPKDIGAVEPESKGRAN